MGTDHIERRLAEILGDGPPTLNADRQLTTGRRALRRRRGTQVAVGALAALMIGGVGVPAMRADRPPTSVADRQSVAGLPQSDAEIVERCAAAALPPRSDGAVSQGWWTTAGQAARTVDPDRLWVSGPPRVVTQATGNGRLGAVLTSADESYWAICRVHADSADAQPAESGVIAFTAKDSYGLSGTFDSIEPRVLAVFGRASAGVDAVVAEFVLANGKTVRADVVDGSFVLEYHARTADAAIVRGPVLRDAAGNVTKQGVLIVPGKAGS
ncbi:MAG: hypothetical protein ACRCYU_03470 [Nocardioides sp.]